MKRVDKEEGHRAQPRVGGIRRVQVQPLDRGLAILKLLSEEDMGATASELAKRIELSTSTTETLLAALQKERFVRFDPDRCCWLIGIQSFMVGSAFIRSRDLVVAARPVMRRLMEESGETINLAIVDRGEAVYLAQVESRETMRAFTRPGSRVPLHCSGVGKALLAGMSDSQLAKALNGRVLTRVTSKTIQSRDELSSALNRIRADGFAFDNEEQAIGLRCVASPIRNEFGGTVAAISLSGPKVRVTDECVLALADLVKRAAADTTSELGGIALGRANC